MSDERDTIPVPRHVPREPGCCGDIPERTQIIEQVSQQCAFAHRSMASLYRTLADDYKDQPEERKALLEAAERQDDMERLSQIVTLPADIEPTVPTV